MDLQEVLNLLVGIVIMGLGWMLNTLWQAHKELTDKHHNHVKEIAMGYVSKDDFKEQIEHIRQTCDNIWKALREHRP